jgi:hypothetical protein
MSACPGYPSWNKKISEPCTLEAPPKYQKKKKKGEHVPLGIAFDLPFASQLTSVPSLSSSRCWGRTIIQHLDALPPCLPGGASAERWPTRERTVFVSSDPLDGIQRSFPTFRTGGRKGPHARAVRSTGTLARTGVPSVPPYTCPWSLGKKNGKPDSNPTANTPSVFPFRSSGETPHPTPTSPDPSTLSHARGPTRRYIPRSSRPSTGPSCRLLSWRRLRGRTTPRHALIFEKDDSRKG